VAPPVRTVPDEPARLSKDRSDPEISCVSEAQPVVHASHFPYGLTEQPNK